MKRTCMVLMFLLIYIPSFAQSVTSEGSLSYSVPIDAPPSINNIVPTISLSYNSSSTDSVAGEGWSICGIPTITIDTSYGISYTSPNHYRHSDGKLVDTGTGNYSLEFDNLSRFSLYDNGKKYWIEMMKDGTIRIYGLTSDSVASSGSGIYSWSLSKVIDVNGNEYTISYEIKNGICYPVSICYGDSGSIIKRTNYIDFHFEYKSASECTPNYRYGTEIRKTGKLRNILVRSRTSFCFTFFGFDIYVRVYKLKYQNDDPTRNYDTRSDSDSSKGKSYLTQIIENGYNNISRTIGTYRYDNGASINSGAIADYNPVSPFIFQNLTTSNFSQLFRDQYSTDGSFKPTMRTGDFNGDGRSDIVFYANDFRYMYFSQGDGTFTLAGYDRRNLTNFRDAMIGDFNGDGIDEILEIESGNCLLQHWDGANVSCISTLAGNWSCSISLGDFNGDGKCEAYAAYHYSQGGLFYLNGSTLTPLATNLNGSTFLNDSNDDNNDKEFYCAARIETNGKSALLYQNFTYSNMADIDVFSWSGSADWSSLPSVSNESAKCLYSAADLNGDGLDDIFIKSPSTEVTGRIKYMYSGTSTWNTVSWPSSGYNNGGDQNNYYIADVPGDLYLGDFNGDGKKDIFIHTTDGTNPSNFVSFSTESGMTDNLTMSEVIHNNIVVGDFNGDGADDMLSLQNSECCLLKGNLTAHGKLQEILNQYGGVTEVLYKSAINADSTLSDGSKMSYPSIKNNHLRFVVSTIYACDEYTDIQNDSYTYTAGRYYNGYSFERKSLGFSSIIKKDIQGITTKTYYNQTYALAGTVSQVLVQDNTNSLISNTLNEWFPKTKFNSSGEAYYHIELSGITTKEFEQGSIIKSSIITNLYYPEGLGENFLHETIEEKGSSKIDTVIEYKTTGDLAVTVPKNITTTSGSLCRIKKFAYESEANPYSPSMVTDYLDNSEINTIITYNSNGTIDTVQEPIDDTEKITRTTEYKYSSNPDFLPSNIIKDKISISRTYDSFGNILSETDSNNTTATYTYDGFGRIVSVNDQNKKDVKKYNYHDELNGTVGNQYVEIDSADTSADGWHYEKIYFDGMMRVIRDVKKADKTSGIEYNKYYYYNNFGQLESETNEYLTGDTPLYTKYEYDKRNRISAVHQDRINTRDGAPYSETVNSTTTYSSTTDYLTVTNTDPKGISSSVIFDARGFLCQKNDPLGAKIVYEIDDFGQLKTVTVNGLAKTSIEYDSLGRKTSITEPNTGTTTYTYYDNGRVNTMTDAKGQVFRYTYDSIGRLKTEATPGADQDIYYKYDNSTSDNSMGRISKILTGKLLSDGTISDTNAITATSFQYDAKGNILKQMLEIDGYSFETVATYDIANRLNKLVYPGTTERFSLDASYFEDGSLSLVKQSGETIPYVNYSLVGSTSDHMVSRITGNRVASYIGYDPVTHRPTTVETGLLKTDVRLEDAAVSGKTSLANVNEPKQEYENNIYSYDADNNITSITDNRDASLSQVFTYDDLNRLKTVTGPFGKNGAAGSIEYDYKLNGNLFSKVTKDSSSNEIEKMILSYENTLHPHAASGSTLDNVNANSYSYDDNGNMTHRKSIKKSWSSDNTSAVLNTTENTIEYNAHNLPSKITTGNKWESYTYDYAGNRIKKETSDGVKTYSIGGLFELNDVLNRNNNMYATYYIHGLNNELVAQKTTTGHTIDEYKSSIWMDLRYDRNPILRIIGQLYYELTVPREVLKKLFKYHTPKLIMIPGIIILLVGMYFRIRYYHGDYTWVRNLVPLTLCIFVSVTGLVSCYSSTPPLMPSSNTASAAATATQQGSSSASPNTSPASSSAAASSTNSASPSLTSSASSSQSTKTGSSASPSTDPVNTVTASSPSTNPVSSPSPGTITTTDVTETYDPTGIPQAGILYMHPNRLGSIQFVTDEAGEVVYRTFYTPYGERVQFDASKDNGLYAASRTTRYGFTGQEEDTTGLMNYGARLYDPQIGRFIQADTVVDDPFSTQGYNRYMYCHGNPVLYVDPTGHSTSAGNSDGTTVDNDTGLDVSDDSRGAGHANNNSSNSGGGHSSYSTGSDLASLGVTTDDPSYGFTGGLDPSDIEGKTDSTGGLAGLADSIDASRNAEEDMANYDNFNRGVESNSRNIASNVVLCGGMSVSSQYSGQTFSVGLTNADKSATDSQIKERQNELNLMIKEMKEQLKIKCDNKEISKETFNWEIKEINKIESKIGHIISDLKNVKNALIEIIKEYKLEVQYTPESGPGI